MSGSVGISFRARSAVENVILVGIDAIVAGNNLIGNGQSHRVSIKIGKNWKTHTRYWNEFSQPSYACPGDNCVGPLAVDKVAVIGWNATEEGKAIDYWIDDVEIIYKK